MQTAQKPIFEWDGEKRFLEVFNQDHTLSSAYKNSVIWVYQQITRDLGFETMATWINKLNYGSCSIGHPENVTTYWLDGSLETSASQQIAFLSRLAKEGLPLETKTMRVGKTIMREDSGDGWVLYAKTGFTGNVGWYVGWVETQREGLQGTYTFAFNMDVTSRSELPLRKAVVRTALDQLGMTCPGQHKT